MDIQLPRNGQTISQRSMRVIWPIVAYILLSIPERSPYESIHPVINSPSIPSQSSCQSPINRPTNPHQSRTNPPTNPLSIPYQSPIHPPMNTYPINPLSIHSSTPYQSPYKSSINPPSILLSIPYQSPINPPSILRIWNSETHTANCKNQALVKGRGVKPGSKRTSSGR